LLNISTAALTFVIAFALVVLLYQAVAGRHLAIKARLGAIRDMQYFDAEAEPLELPFNIRIIQPLVKRIYNFFNGLLPANLEAAVEQKLTRCGNPRGLKARTFLSSIFMVALVLTPVGFFVPLALGLGFGKAGILSLNVLFISILAPTLWLYATEDGRVTQIDRTLPDAIDLMVVCVEAGLGLDMAMSRVSERIKGPLAVEFTRALHEMQVGKSRQEALRDLSRRAGSHNLSSFLAMVIQGTQMGVTMGQILRIQSETMRRVRRQRAQEQAFKAPVKLVFPLVFCIFPALFVVILGPAVIQIIKSGLFK